MLIYITCSATTGNHNQNFKLNPSCYWCSGSVSGGRPPLVLCTPSPTHEPSVQSPYRYKWVMVMGIHSPDLMDCGPAQNPGREPVSLTITGPLVLQVWSDLGITLLGLVNNLSCSDFYAITIASLLVFPLATALTGTLVLQSTKTLW